MHTHGVYVLDETHRDEFVVIIPDHFQFKFLPSQNRLFDQNLTDQTGRDPTGSNDPQLVQVVDQPAAGAAHGIRWADHNGIAQTGRHPLGILYRVDRFALGHFYPERVHGILEGRPILAPLDRVELHTDDLDIVFVENPPFRKVGGQVKTGLAAEIRQQCIWTFFGDDLLERLHIQGLDVGHVRHPGIGHDCGRV